MESSLHSSPLSWPARLRRDATRLGLAAPLFLLALSAGADVLVLRDGSRIETQGKWEQKGRQLVFTTATGTLSAIRASEVDLAASEKATAAAAAPKAPEPKAEVAKKPVMVLTDKDVPKAAAEPQGEVAGEAAPAPAGPGKVAVVSSRIEPTDGGDNAFSVRGSVRNDSPVPVSDVRVMAIATVSRDEVSRRVYCQTSLDGPLAVKATVEFACQIKRQEVLATGMADAFGDAALSFEVQSTPQVPPPATPPPAQQPPRR
jgi:hypothetical protein